MHDQRKIEQAAFRLGGGDYTAPAQLVGDFLADRPSHELGAVRPTCPTGVLLGDIAQVLPARVIEVMRAALVQMDQKLKASPCRMRCLPRRKRALPRRCAFCVMNFCSRTCAGFTPAEKALGLCGRHCVGGGGWYRCAEMVLRDEQ